MSEEPKDMALLVIETLRIIAPQLKEENLSLLKDILRENQKQAKLIAELEKDKVDLLDYLECIRCECTEVSVCIRCVAIAKHGIHQSQRILERALPNPQEESK